MSTAGLVIVGVAELIKLTNTLLAASVQAAALAKMSESEQEAAYQKAKAEYAALPLPQDISEPKQAG